MKARNQRTGKKGKTGGKNRSKNEGGLTQKEARETEDGGS